MARKKGAKKGGELGSFVQVPHRILNSHAYTKLTPYAVKLLFDLLAQYKGFNNGDLCAAWSMMVKRGWRSKATLAKAIAELKDSGWIEVSRQGGKHKATLYAVTFFSVDACNGKLDIASTTKPAGTWKTPEDFPGLNAKIKSSVPLGVLN